MAYSNFAGTAVISAIVGTIVFRINHPFAGWDTFGAAGSIKFDINELSPAELSTIQSDLRDVRYDEGTRIFKIHSFMDSELEFNSSAAYERSTLLFGQIAHEYFEQHPYSFCKVHDKPTLPYFELMVWGSFAVSYLFYGFTLWPIPIVLSVLGYVTTAPLSFFIHEVREKLHRVTMSIIAKRLRTGELKSTAFDEVKQFMENMK